ncbi:hypothetical protein [Xanthomonas sp. XNM01]|uniref:hypothetical protein n=1 Tax=Xanthomonas sp. XNM01 TaxID=2769289 RepID=UPI0017802206|nr:hypothetical protein [Xanthomonas sp. XNM01]MBD9368386.1 hypothetical protein [Xanthomonas sp. XNM01]
MAKPPVIDADQMGAVIDAVTTTNAALFTLLASREESDAALQLLDRLVEQFDKKADPLNMLRQHVIEATANSIRGVQAIREGKPPADAVWGQ